QLRRGLWAHGGLAEDACGQKRRRQGAAPAPECDRRGGAGALADLGPDARLQIVGCRQGLSPQPRHQMFDIVLHEIPAAHQSIRSASQKPARVRSPKSAADPATANQEASGPEGSSAPARIPSAGVKETLMRSLWKLILRATASFARGLAIGAGLLLSA